MYIDDAMPLASQIASEFAPFLTSADVCTKNYKHSSSLACGCTGRYNGIHGHACVGFQFNGNWYTNLFSLGGVYTLRLIDSRNGTTWQYNPKQFV